METKRNKKYWLPLFMAASMVLGLLAGVLLTRNSDVRLMDRRMSSLNKLSALMSLIDAKYVDTVDMSQITEDLIPQLLSELDPHSVYLSAEDRKLTDEQLEGSFSGVGIQFTLLDDTISILSVVKGGPSERLGIRAGDQIVRINDSIVAGVGIKNDQILKTLRGVKGAPVTVGIKRARVPELLSITIHRDDIPVHSLDARYKIGEDIGYIKLGTFGRMAYTEFLQAVAYLKADGCSRFIVDLRGNTGGLMEPALQIANEFLPAKSLILYTQGKAYPREEVFSTGRGSCQNDPLVVLTDEWSASSSEILAGSLQDNDRAYVVGRRSFGKGLVQNEIPFKDGSAVRLTIARFYVPSGRSIQKPYQNGEAEAYQMDILNRYMKGEFDSKDSIKLIDSLQYETVSGRTVYGGGGIMPDYFVPLDTSGVTAWYTQVMNKGLLTKYTFQFVNQYRDSLEQLKTPNQLSDWLEDHNIVEDFVRYAQRQNVRGRTAFIAASFPLVLTQIKAGIARLILGDDAYWKLLQEQDPTLNKAVEVVVSADSAIHLN